MKFVIKFGSKAEFKLMTTSQKSAYSRFKKACKDVFGDALRIRPNKKSKK
jgi:plasmid replication initiation protein